MAASTAAGPWSFGARGSVANDPSGERKPWAAAANAGCRVWRAGWAGDADGSGEGRVGWIDGPFEASFAWGPRDGWEAKAQAEVLVGAVAVSAQGTAGLGASGASGRAGVSLSGRVDRGRWSGAWSVGPGTEAPAQSVTAAWKEATLEAEGRWTVEGLRLGWIGPGTGFELTVRWLF